MAVFVPALVHGTSIGPYDILTQYGLSAHSGVEIHNRQTFDQVLTFVPWTDAAWRQVHAGHLPLWNPYSVLGLPLAFNWQSAVFSVPALAGYAMPLHLAYTAQLLVTMVIAGTGVYVLGRILGLGTMGCVVAGTVFELSGPFMGWLGWANSGVMSWAGWLFAATLFLIRGRRRVVAVTWFALVTAAMVYAGFPETCVIAFLALAFFAVVVLAHRMRFLGGSGPILVPAVDLVVATVAGVALSAPLSMPALQLSAKSIRSAAGSIYPRALPLHDLIGVVFQGFDGMPSAGSRYFGSRGYSYLAAYVGVVGVVLVVTAVGRRWTRPEVRALALVAVVAGVVTYAEPLRGVLVALPSALGQFTWSFALLPMIFALSVLAGIGADVVVGSWEEAATRRCLGGAFAVCGVLVLAVWLFGRGPLPPVEAGPRNRSFWWPAATVVVGLVLVGMLLPRRRGSDGARSTGIPRGAVAGAVLLLCETAFLVASGAPLLSSSPTYAPETAAERTLQRAVGDGVVACGTVPCWGDPLLRPEPGISTGVLPDYNIVLGVREFAAYDPVVPASYFTSWQSATGANARPFLAPTSVFGPVMSKAGVARLYGTRFILEPEGRSGPTGTVRVTRVGDEELYRVPGAAMASFVRLPSGGGPPGVLASGAPVPVVERGTASWRFRTSSSRAGLLRIRLTDVPGWHATLDGRPLELRRFAGVMLQASVPAGRHVIELHYLPTRFTVGLVSAALTVVALVVGLAVDRARRRRRRLVL